VLVYRWLDMLDMVVNASNREKILAWISHHQDKARVKVTDTTRQSCMIAVQGPKAVEMCQGLTPTGTELLPYYFAIRSTYQGSPYIVSRTGYTGEDGLEFTLSAELGSKFCDELGRRGVRPCGLGARDTLRLEAAMPLYGHELNEETDPFQAGLAWAVKMDKGDFIGRGALAKRKLDTSLLQRVGLELDGKRIARGGAAVLREGKTIGKVSSGTFAPTLEKTLAMAYVPAAFTTPGTTCEVDIRGKPSAARVVPLPFYSRKRKP
jgi:aminomethyltransferase